MPGVHSAVGTRATQVRQPAGGCMAAAKRMVATTDTFPLPSPSLLVAGRGRQKQAHGNAPLLLCCCCCYRRRGNNNDNNIQPQRESGWLAAPETSVITRPAPPGSATRHCGTAWHLGGGKGFGLRVHPGCRLQGSEALHLCILIAGLPL